MPPDPVVGVVGELDVGVLLTGRPGETVGAGDAPPAGAPPDAAVPGAPEGWVVGVVTGVLPDGAAPPDRPGCSEVPALAGALVTGPAAPRLLDDDAGPLGAVAPPPLTPVDPPAGRFAGSTLALLALESAGETGAELAALPCCVAESMTIAALSARRDVPLEHPTMTAMAEQT